MSKLNKLIHELCPNGVKFLELEKISSYRRGSFPQPYTNDAFYGGEGAMPFVQVADMLDDAFSLAEETKQTISKVAQPKSVFVPKGTVLVSLQGTLGRVAITQYDSYVDRTIAIFFKYDKRLDQKFFAYALKQKFDFEKQRARGSTLKTITKEEFSSFKIPVPPLEVQREIVRILDNFTKLRAELTAELKVRESQFEHYKDRLFEFDDFQLVKLGDVAHVYDGTHQTPEYKAEGIPFISVENIGDIYGSRKFITPEAFSKYKVKPQINDVFMTRIGSIGKCAVMTKQNSLAYYVSLALIRPKTDAVLPFYLKYFLESGFGKSELAKRTLFHAVPTKINKDDIGKIYIKVPSIEKQFEIVKLLSTFDSLLNNVLIGLPAEIEARKKQYEYYRDRLLTFQEAK